MEGLLKWSIDAAHTGKVENPPDPKMLSQLLGAPDDVTMMREELKAAVESEDKDVRLECLDRFEEHIENIDNADNMGKLWEPLLYLVKDKDDDIRAQALSCVGAAVQNNHKAQSDLVATKSGMNTILGNINDPNLNVAAKALLAVSSAVAHCEAAYDQFVAANGWEIFTQVFSAYLETDEDRSEKIRSRVLSLLNAIVVLAPNKSVLDEVSKHDLVNRLKKLDQHSSGIVKEKIGYILDTLKDNPRQETRLLALN